jgi:SEC-C motif domain protein
VKHLKDDQPCPCGRLGATGRVLAYAQCCGRCLELAQGAVDAETLMRSRYTAFVLERATYLLSTWSASHRPDGIDFDPDAKWLGLEVRAINERDAEHAEVEFVARHRVAGRAVRLHERSRFIKEAGHWCYLDGMT